MLRALALVLILVTSSDSWAQGLLRSILLNQKDTTVICTLVIRSYDNWDNPTYHYFKRSTATYLQRGEYVVSYKIDTVWLHAEWIRISGSGTVLSKYILSERIQLSKMTFVLPKGKPRIKDGQIFLDF